MIFVARVITFSLLIVAGFAVAVRNIVGRKIVTVVYFLTLLYYTFLCHIPTSVPVVADDSIAPTTAMEQTMREKIGQVIVEIFGLQPNYNGSVFKTKTKIFRGFRHDCG